MGLRIDPTPNANAMKVTVEHGQPAPRTVRDPATAPEGLPRDLIALPGVVQVFFSDGFLTVNKDPGASWDDLLPAVEDALHRHVEA